METILRAGLSNAVAATFLAVGVACLTRPLARRPAVLHFLWLLVLLKLVTPPLYEVSLEWPGSLARTEKAPAPGAGCQPEWADGSTVTATAPQMLDLAPLALEAILVEPEAVRGPAVSFPAAAGPFAGGWSSMDWVRLLAVVWAVGAVGALVIACRRVRRFQHLLGAARPASPADQEWVEELASVLELRRTPSVWWVGGTLSPMIWPLGWRPRLIIPRDLWKTLDERQRTTLVLHELAHLRRGDHRLRFVELCVTILYWWHPLVWWVRHALRDAEEACCDAWVVWASPDSAKTYAETLLETLDFLNRYDLSEPLLASGFGKVDHLRRRLTMIMSGTIPRRLGTWGVLGALALAAVLLPVGATWAQKPEKLQEGRFVVKSLEDLNLNKAGDAVARIETETDSAQVSLDELVLAVDDAQPGQIILNLKTDDLPEVVVSGPIDEAIAKLRERLEAITKKSPLSEQDASRAKAIKQALVELFKIAEQLKRSKPGERAAEKKVLVLRPYQVHLKTPISPEKKPEIDKVRGQVQKLTRELEEKQRELAEARARLAKLEGAHALRVVQHLRLEPDTAKPGTASPKHVVRPARAWVIVGSDAKTLPDLPGLPGSVPGWVVRVPSDQQRLAALERTLRKLIDELDSLKKERATASIWK